MRRLCGGALLFALVGACGADDADDGNADGASDDGADDGSGDGSDDGADDGGGDGDRGGPDSLVGVEWTSEPVTVKGIEFVFGFRFDEDTVTATNTCNGALTAEATAPVRYLYTADVPESGRAEEVDGDATCTVEIAAGAFDFEIAGGKLVMRFDGETLEFEPAGDVAGLYGEWTASAPGIGTLTWSLGDGAIVAVNECENGLTAEVEVAADFTNEVEFTEAAEDLAEDGTGLECFVSIAAGTSSYRFDGDDLVLTTDGQEIRLGSD